MSSEYIRMAVPMADFMSNLAVSTFTCGYCWESPGRPCRRSNGKDAWRIHEARRQAVIRAIRDSGGVWPWDGGEDE